MIGLQLFAGTTMLEKIHILIIETCKKIETTKVKMMNTEASCIIQIPLNSFEHYHAYERIK